MKTDSDSENKFPPWLLSGLADAAPCPAALALGAEGDGATLFAERLALKFAGAEDQRWNLQNCPDILAARPDLPKSKPEEEKTHYGVDAVRGGDEGGEDSGGGSGGSGGSGGGGTKTRRVGIVEFAGMRPKALPFRVVLIRRADRMTPQAANALLKTLEEPGRTTRFILTSPAARLLLPTVASRCRVLLSPRPSAEQASAWVRAAGRDAADLAFFANRPLDAADEDTKRRTLRREAIGMFRAGKDLDLNAAIKIFAALPASDWLEWLQKWTADAARAATGLPPRFFPDEAAALSRLASGNGRAFLDLHSSLVRRRLLTQTLNASLLAADALDDYCRASSGRFTADYSAWEF